MERRRIVILGSSGSIGTQALDVIARFPERFEVVGLAAGRRIDVLAEQAHRFNVRRIASAADGPHALVRLATETGADVILAATDGFVAFDAVLSAAERGIDLALANKEVIVAGGELVAEAARQSGARLLPVDSEHSALFQCLAGESRECVRRVVLTASGGPFRTWTHEAMARATREDALAHPTWRMGTKITIDSATLMNKGLEVIEAARLFGFSADQIDVVVHPQSAVHGMVVFRDGTVKSQVGPPNMRVPIGYAIAYPDRLPFPAASGEDDVLAPLGAAVGSQTYAHEYERPDAERFPCLALAYAALRRGGTAPAILSAANEIAVRGFLEGAIPFGAIPDVIARTMERVDSEPVSVENVRKADRLAREVATRAASELHNIEV